MELFDSHSHLDMLPGWTEDAKTGEAAAAEIGAVVARARAAGVTGILVPGVAWADMEPVLAIATRYPDVWAAVGIHPHEADSWEAGSMERLRRLARHPRVVALGEAGLDHYYTHGSREAQVRAFSGQITLAHELDLPLIVHSRDAEDETLGLLRAGPPTRGVLHCFTGSWQLAASALELGYHVSFSGVVTFPKSAELREIARRVPLERTLIETDAPYLAPPPHRGKRNEPAFVAQVAAALAAVHEVSVEELGRLTAANARRLFNLC